MIVPLDALGNVTLNVACPITGIRPAQYGAWCIYFQLPTGVIGSVYYPRGVKHASMSTVQLNIRNILRKAHPVQEVSIVHYRMPGTLKKVA